VSELPYSIRPVYRPPNIQIPHPASGGEIEVRVFIRTPADCDATAGWFKDMAIRFRRAERGSLP